MRYKKFNDWDLTRTEAVEVQKRLREQVRVEPLKREPRLVAGCDISFNKFSEIVYAGIVVLRLPGLEIVDRATAITRDHVPLHTRTPLFSRDPCPSRSREKLNTSPDVVMLDGQGLAHPGGPALPAQFWIDNRTPRSRMREDCACRAV